MKRKNFIRYKVPTYEKIKKIVNDPPMPDGSKGDDLIKFIIEGIEGDIVKSKKIIELEKQRIKKAKHARLRYLNYLLRNVKFKKEILQNYDNYLEVKILRVLNDISYYDYDESEEYLKN